MDLVQGLVQRCEQAGIEAVEEEVLDQGGVSRHGPEQGVAARAGEHGSVARASALDGWRSRRPRASMRSTWWETRLRSQPIRTARSLSCSRWLGESASAFRTWKSWCDRSLSACSSRLIS